MPWLRVKKCRVFLNKKLSSKGWWRFVAYHTTSSHHLTKHKALEAVRNALDRDDIWKETTNLTAREIILLCSICLITIEFKYQGELYLQKKGLPMGGSLSPVVAELVMQDMEREFFSQCELLDMMPKQWLRLVDDIFVLGEGSFFPKWLCIM